VRARVVSLVGKHWPIILILLGATLLRLWGIGFGLPHPEARPDETTVVYVSLRALLFELKPASLIYPTLYTYVLAGIYAAYAFVAGLIGAGDGVSGLLYEYASRPGTLLLINRLLAASFGLATVVAAYKTADVLVGKRAGLLAGAFLGFCYLHVRDSHFGTLDVPMTALIAWSVFFVAKWRAAPSALNYALAGLFAGLATGTKYAGILMAAHGLIAHAVVLRCEGRPIRACAADKRPWIFLAALLVGFFVSTPYAFLDFKQLTADYGYHKDLHGVMDGSSLWHHLSFSLRHGMGLPLLLAGTIGFVLMAARERRAFLLLCPFLVFYLAVLTQVSSTYVRYAIPALPFLCLTAAYAGEKLLARVSIAKLQPAAAWALPVALLALPVTNSVRLDLLLSREDSRNAAAQAVRNTVPAGSSIAVLASAWGAPVIPWDSEFYAVRADQAEKQGNPFKANLYRAWDQALAASGPPRYKRADEPPAPAYLILEDSPLSRFHPQPPKSGLDQYEVLMEIQAADVGVEGNSYDDADAFYLPYSGFRGVLRPGPTLRILGKRR
jgi:hypothetical protein